MIIVNNLDAFNLIKESLIKNPDNKELYQKLLDFEFDITAVQTEQIVQELGEESGPISIPLNLIISTDSELNFRQYLD